MQQGALQQGEAQVRILVTATDGDVLHAEQLRAYLSDLHQAAEEGLAPYLHLKLQPIELWLLDPAEWSRRSPYPYGLPFYRRLRNGRGVVVAPLTYPALYVLERVATIARQQGHLVPGSLTHFLDLTLGHELGHALADQIHLRTHVRWLDEFLATYLYLAALRRASPLSLEQVVQWGEALASTEAHCLLGNPVLLEHPRRDLGSFEYGLVRLPLANQAWYQAQFTLQAAKLERQRGFEFITSLLQALPTMNDRGDIHRLVIAIEPSFRTWFRSFSNTLSP